MRCDAWNVLVDTRAGSSLPHVGMVDRTGRLGLAQVQVHCCVTTDQARLIVPTWHSSGIHWHRLSMASLNGVNT